MDNLSMPLYLVMLMAGFGLIGGGYKMEQDKIKKATSNYPREDYATVSFTKYEPTTTTFHVTSAPQKAGPLDQLYVKFEWVINGIKSYDTALTIINDLKPGDPILVYHMQTKNSAGKINEMPTATRPNPVPSKE